jgi:NAD(P)-dependent dehydrogenase (short-subunit alcohol dehydrogenase family)
MAVVKTVFTCCTVSVALFAVFMGAVISGVWSTLGGNVLLAKLHPGMIGMTPAFLTESEKHAFRLEDMQDLTGHVTLVTGANNGLGYATSYHMARVGSTVVMLCRNEAKCNTAADEMRASFKSAGVANAGELVPMVMDTSSLQSVDQLTTEFKKRFNRLDHLILNAGIGNGNGKRFSVDNIELVFATNHVGHFKLYKDLSGIMEATAAEQGIATVTVISSAAHYFPIPEVGINLNLEALNAIDTPLLYGQSKLANVLFAQEIAKRMQDKNVVANSCHPGAVATNIWQNLFDAINKKASPHVAPYMIAAINWVLSEVMWTSESGALTQLYLSASKDVLQGKING